MEDIDPLTWDFGFTLVDEDELDAVQAATEQVQTFSSSADTTQEKLDTLYNAIQPLLGNLKQDPLKQYILWPDRAQKVEQFSDMLDKIYMS